MANEVAVTAGDPEKEYGTSGLNISTAGTVEDEYLPALKGTRKYKVYRQMGDDDPIIGAGLGYTTMLMRQVGWRVEENPEGDSEDAEFLSSCMEDMSHSWGDFIAEACTMLQYGFAPFEVTYKHRSGYQKPGSKKATSKHRDGKIGWRKIALRGQDTVDRWLFDDEGGIEGIVQKAPPLYRDAHISIEKMLLLRTTSNRNNPEGRSVLRSAYRPWFYRQRLEQIEGVGFERDLGGLPKISVDPKIMRADASPQEQAQRRMWEQLGSEIRYDKRGFVMLPSLRDDKGHRLYDIELMSSGGHGRMDVNQSINRYRTEIAQALFADFMMLGHGQTGSNALSVDKTEMFTVAISAYLDIIADSLNRHLVPRLFRLNGRPTDHLPRFVRDDVQKADPKALIDVLAAAVGAGLSITPDVEVEHYVRDLAGLPAKTPEATQAAEEAIAFQRDQAAKERAMANAPTEESAAETAADPTAPTTLTDPTPDPTDPNAPEDDQ